MAKGWKQTEEAKKRMSGAKLGMKHSEEYKQKLSEVMKSKFASGEIKKQHRNWTPEQKAKMEAYWSKPKSEEVRQQISETMKKKIASGELVVKQHSWPKGKYRSNETKEKLSVANSKQILEGRFKFGASYDGVNMQNDKEMLFAMWCDINNIKWEYQPLIFFIRFGVRYIPDFLLLDSNEFVEVGEIETDRKKRKLDAFVKAGNILHHAVILENRNLGNLFDLGDGTRWAERSI